MSSEHNAKVIGRYLPISRKFSVEMCRYIRKKPLAKAQYFVEGVLNKKWALPLFRYRKEVSHKPGRMAAGRYPYNVSKEFLNLLNTVGKNAENKGLDVSSLVIDFASASPGVGRWHSGRQRRRRFKSTNVEIRVKEGKEEKAKTFVKGKSKGRIKKK